MRKRSNKPEIRLEWIEAGTLKANPRNWRRHPDRQVRALKASLGELGWLKPIVFNEQTGNVIDGHARLKDVPAKQPVPVFVVSLSPEKERRALLVLDSITQMAEADPDALESLLRETELTGDLSPIAEDLESFLGPSESADLRPLTVQKPPAMTWVLLGIPTVRFNEINADVERIAKLEGVVCEMTVGDAPAKDQK